MTVVITGIGGLLGGELAREARRLGHRVIGLARRHEPALDGRADEMIIEDLAVGTCHDWRRLADGAVVFHLAANTRIHGPAEAFERDNVRATATACAIARQTGAGLIFFSSAAVYSGPGTIQPGSALREDGPTDPATPYGRSKRAAELLVSAAGLPAMIFRLFGVLSDSLLSRSGRGNLVPAIERTLTSGAPLVLGLGPTGQPAVRDYVLGEDIARWALLAGRRLTGQGGRTAPAQVLNLCTGVPTSTAELARLAGVANGQIRYEARRSAENEVMVGDGTALRQEFGAVPACRVVEFWRRAATDRRAPTALG